jgi:uncharacterized protein YecE (DUF72 family)
MAEQISLFSGSLAPFSTVEPAAKPARRRPTAPAFDDEPQLCKYGPPSRLMGTSSWTYPGWHGSVYRDVEAYGSSQRFTELSLTEYARDPRFRCAGADNMYYMPPSHRRSLLKKYAAQLGRLREPVKLCPKVWHGVTVNRYTPLQQKQWRLPSEVNSHFLDPAVFLHDVAEPLAEELGAFLGPLILELQETDIHEAEFCQLLDGFLGQVRGGFAGLLAVELRTPTLLTPRYLSVLRSHEVAHVLNSWTRMPAIGWQWDKLRAHGSADGPFFLIRALLRPGVRYEDASVFEPYDRIVTRAPEVRADILRVLREAPQDRTGYVLVNNHLEGHSPGTIAELQKELWP